MCEMREILGVKVGFEVFILGDWVFVMFFEIEILIDLF